MCSFRRALEALEKRGKEGVERLAYLDNKELIITLNSNQENPIGEVVEIEKASSTFD